MNELRELYKHWKRTNSVFDFELWYLHTFCHEFYVNTLERGTLNQRHEAHLKLAKAYGFTNILEVQKALVRLDQPEETHIGGFFIGQFEVFYNTLNMDFLTSRAKAYENTVKYFDMPKYEESLKVFIKTYQE